MQVGGSGIGTDTLRLHKIDGPFKKKTIRNLPVTSSNLPSLHYTVLNGALKNRCFPAFPVQTM